MDVSLVDLTLETEKPMTKDSIHAAMKKAAESGPMKGILYYSDEQLGQLLRHRHERELRVGLTLRPAQVRREHHPRPSLEGVPDRREALADAAVFGDATGRGQRHVEVDANEHAPAFDVELVDGLDGHVPRSLPEYNTRGDRRG